ncbi:M3 family oligoendopeptidase [bacterium]|nr:M3 family oligoendopeptidase [bacterium]
MNQIVKKKKTIPRCSASGVRWNLQDLYSSPTDPAIENDYNTAKSMAENFEKKYKWWLLKKREIKAKELVQIVREYEKILLLRDRPLVYSHLLFAEDTQNAEFGKLLQKMQMRATEIQTHMLFWELDWCQISDEVAKKLIEDPACLDYKHFLSASRRYRPHLLSEPEEKIVAEMKNTGVHAFSRYFDEMLGRMKFSYKLGGETKEMSEQELLSLLHDGNREVRIAAAKALTSGFKENERSLAFIFNTIVQEHSTMDRLRHFQEPMSARNLSNEIDAKTVQALLKACDQNTGLVQRYYRLKAKLLGLKKLYDYDRYAPVSAKMPACEWKETKKIVVDAYHQFSPEFGKIVTEFFEKSWIDAEIRPGKRGGAFCSSATPDVHPFILVNYTDRLRDVMTVAHELGHGVHQYLSRKQGYLQSDTPLTLAETASVFGEMIVFHRLIEEETDPAVKLSLLCGKIEDAFATVFRQVCLTHFEQNLHGSWRKEGELTPEKIGGFWMKANAAMFGDSVTLTEGYGSWWCYIPHFIHTPFYCYAYSFGELLVLSLYNLYRKEGRKFVPKFMNLLSSGGSESPNVLTKRIGLDITKAGFWNNGMQILSEMVEEAEKLANNSKK